METTLTFCTLMIVPSQKSWKWAGKDTEKCNQNYQRAETPSLQGKANVFGAFQFIK